MNPLYNLSKYEILLASGSPRRRQLLKDLCIDFKLARLIDVDESYPENLDPLEVASYISKKKADAYKSQITSNQLVITADTVVVNDREVLGKPCTQENAARMLNKLSGKKHKVITGVTVTSAEKQSAFSAITEVEFALLTENEIKFYISKFNPLDKAGAYGIQEWIGCIGVKSINGSFYNVMGLPLHKLYNELKNF